MLSQYYYGAVTLRIHNILPYNLNITISFETCSCTLVRCKLHTDLYNLEAFIVRVSGWRDGPILEAMQCIQGSLLFENGKLHFDNGGTVVDFSVSDSEVLFNKLRLIVYNITYSIDPERAVY